MTAATAGDKLLEDIIAHPDDDGLRLIYADWLEDHGRPGWAARGHAALVRAMVPRPDCAVLLRRGRRPRKIGRLDVPPEAWQFMPRAAPENLGGDTLGYDALRAEAVLVRRGFVDEVRLPLAAWLEHGPALVKAHPLRRVELTDRRPRLGGRRLTPDRPGRPADAGGWRLWLADPELPYTLDIGLPPAIWGLIRAPLATSHQKLFPETEAVGPDGAEVPEGTRARRDADDALSAACLAWARGPVA